MKRSSGASGFTGHCTPAASSRLTHAVAAALAIGAVSLCLIATITALSTEVTMAMPIPG